MTRDRIEHVYEETYCEYCGEPLRKGDAVYWDAGERHPYCSPLCVETDARYAATFAARPLPPPVRTLADLSGALVLGVKRNGSEAVVLLERRNGVQIALGFSGVTRFVARPAAGARIRSVQRRKGRYAFVFGPGAQAALRIRATRHTLAAL